jgi:Cu(I)/Ag(I) efflux system membrane fusion protein
MNYYKIINRFTLKLLPVWILLMAGCQPKEMDATTTQSNITSATSEEIMFNETQMLLANITTQPVKSQEIGETVVVSGKLVADEDQVQTISSRVQGRIEKLFVKETGREIKKGDPVYEIYSESLLTLQREYLLAKEQFEKLSSPSNQYESFFNAAARKLSLYGLSDVQIKTLGESKNIQPTFTFHSPVGGSVKSIDVVEGQTVAEGATLYQLENNRVLWLEAELFPSEPKLAKPENTVSVRIGGLENEMVEATIFFVSPELASKSVLTIMRARIKNENGTLRAGMPAEVFISHSTTKGIAIPSNAVIRDQHGSRVYVKQGANTFRPQMVETGLEDGNRIEIKSGLNEKDTIAVTGAYLIYSEYILKRGDEPMAAMHEH